MPTMLNVLIQLVLFIYVSVYPLYAKLSLQISLIVLLYKQMHY